MTVYSPQFDISQFELRGKANPFLNTQQLIAVTDATRRVPNQLNWLAQLLGWSGRNYWFSLASTVDEKRQLLGGSFGVYNSYLYPEIVEVRNWENCVVVKNNTFLEENQEVIVGDYSYKIISITQENGNLKLQFEDLPDRFYRGIANGDQLRVNAQKALPKPFYRPNVGASGDAGFVCQEDDGNLILYPEYDTQKTVPYFYNTFYAGARYYFDKPVILFLTEDSYIAPSYDFPSLRWYIDVPCNSGEITPGLAARLEYNGCSLVMGIKEWVDPSDWFQTDTLKFFKGVWGNKGGPLPFHFAFDSLSLHGFDPNKSIYVGAIEREIQFDTLLNFVYQQTTQISPLPPSLTEPSQVWWNSQTGSFSVHSQDSTNCGPWVECAYPTGLEKGVIPDYIFPDVASFESYGGDFIEGGIVQIVNGTGLDINNKILGITQTLTQPAQVIFFQSTNAEGWVPLEFIYQDKTQFNADAKKLPNLVRVTILNGAGLSGTGTNYKIENLKITVTGQYKVVLMKSETTGSWYISPPSELKYIGNTRLFSSSLDYSNPTEGEMFWDFTETDPQQRVASIFYYNRWEYNIVESEWELKGDWVNINDVSSLSSPPPQVLNFGVVKVYQNGDLLIPGKPVVTEDYQFKYTIDTLTGSFQFQYLPKTIKGSVNFPVVTVSDSLTSSYTFDISHLVFSGVVYYASPNTEDSETLLRVWKSETLFCVDDQSSQTTLSYPNGLVADNNNGPANDNWERFFVKLPPCYGRNGKEWQRVNTVCQNFAYWGSSPSPEDMSCPAKNERPRVYEEVTALLENPVYPVYLYSEPYLYSAVVGEFGHSGDYENSAILPSFDDPYDTFLESEIIPYDPLHERSADTNSSVNQGYGDWEGSYFRTDECSSLSGHLIVDIEREVLESMPPPVWDASIYKYPQTCILDEESGRVDANHYKVGYAVFCADLSAAEEAVFTFG